LDSNSVLLVSLGLAGGGAAELLKWYGIREIFTKGFPTTPRQLRTGW